LYKLIERVEAATGEVRELTNLVEAGMCAPAVTLAPRLKELAADSSELLGELAMWKDFESFVALAEVPIVLDAAWGALSSLDVELVPEDLPAYVFEVASGVLAHVEEGEGQGWGGASATLELAIRLVATEALDALGRPEDGDLVLLRGVWRAATKRLDGGLSAPHLVETLTVVALHYASKLNEQSTIPLFRELANYMRNERLGAPSPSSKHRLEDRYVEWKNIYADELASLSEAL